jgi:hypothetical protein
LELATLVRRLLQTLEIYTANKALLLLDLHWLQVRRLEMSWEVSVNTLVALLLALLLIPSVDT